MSVFKGHMSQGVSPLWNTAPHPANMWVIKITRVKLSFWVQLQGKASQDGIIGGWQVLSQAT